MTSTIGFPLRLIGFVVVLCIAAPALPSAVLAAVSGDAAARNLEAAYGVRALKVRPGEVGGRTVWLVTVMNPAGDSNAAFQVNTLAVDQETGELVPSFRHGTSGFKLLSDGPRGDKVGLRPEAVRSRAWR